MKKVLIIIRDLWKGFSVVILGTSLLIFSLLIPFHSFLPPWVHRDDSYNIKPRGYRSLSIGLRWGSIIRGMLVISGGEGYIRFSIEDSGGNIIIADERASDRYFFEFQSDKTDSYILVLDNSDSSAGKSVYWIVWIYYYHILFPLLGVAISIAGVIATLREERRLSSKVEETLERASKDVETSLHR